MEPTETVKMIISGGQTGADMGALLAARELGLMTGGYAPKGWKTENGPNPGLRDFGLIELSSDDYNRRTRVNIDGADATMVVIPGGPGTRLTERLARERKKPVWLVDHTQPVDMQVELARDFIARAAITTGKPVTILNVGGPRASKVPYVEEWTYDIIMAIFS